MRLAFRLTAMLIATVLAMALVLHILVLVRVVPYQMVWGGRIDSLQALYIAESISLTLNGIILTMVLGFLQKLPFRFSPIAYRAGFTLISVLFGINTVGNLLSHNSIERALFTPITVLLMVGFAVLAFAAGKPTSHG